MPTLDYVITDLAIGGVPLHLARLAPAVRDAGYEVRVVSLAPPGPVAAPLGAAGIEVVTCNARNGRDIRALWRLRRLLRDRRPELVHALLFHANLAVRCVGPGAGVPARRIVCEIQTVEIERPWHLRLDRWTIRRCAVVIGNSPSVIAHLRDHGGLPAEQLRLVHGGIDVTPIREATPLRRDQLDVPENCRLLVWTGRLDPVKGLDVLLHAMANVARRHDAVLLLAGQGAEEARLRGLADDLGLSSRVRFLGPRDDVPALLQSAEVFVFPSLTEGLPNALLEAMAAGCAIVCTAVPGNRDLIRADEDGLMVPSGDADALATAIDTLLTDTATAHRLGRSAAARARTFDFAATIAGYQQVYDELLKIS